MLDVLWGLLDSFVGGIVDFLFDGVLRRAPSWVFWLVMVLVIAAIGGLWYALSNAP